MESEIEGLISAGWKPRIKTKGNRKYITLRKGNKERGFGLYTDTLWEKIKLDDPWVTPEQLSKVKKRMLKIEQTQERQAIHFNVEMFKSVKQLEESQQETDKSSNALHLNFEKMSQSLLISARRRLRGISACIHIDKNGVCNAWYWNCKLEDTPVHLRPMKMSNYKGQIIYRVSVIDHPLMCSACPSYRRRS